MEADFFIPLDMPCRSPRAHFTRAYGRRTERPPGRNPVSNEASVEASVRMSCAKKCVTTAPRKGDIAGAAAVYPRRFRRQTRPAICGILVRGFWTNTEPSPKEGLVPRGLRHAPGCRILSPPLAEAGRLPHVESRRTVLAALYVCVLLFLVKLCMIKL